MSSTRSSSPAAAAASRARALALPLFERLNSTLHTLMYTTSSTQNNKLKKTSNNLYSRTITGCLLSLVNFPGSRALLRSVHRIRRGKGADKVEELGCLFFFSDRTGYLPVGVRFVHCQQIRCVRLAFASLPA